MPENDELQLELFTHQFRPMEPPCLDWGVSWGIELRIGWFKLRDKAEACWCVAVANVDTSDTSGVSNPWTPGKVPEMRYVPLDDYLEKMERLFGIINAARGRES